MDCRWKKERPGEEPHRKLRGKIPEGLAVSVAAGGAREVLREEDFAEVGCWRIRQRGRAKPQGRHKKGHGESDAPLGGRQLRKSPVPVGDSYGGDNQDGQNEADWAFCQNRQTSEEEGRENLRRRHLAVAGKEEGIFLFTDLIFVILAIADFDILTNDVGSSSSSAYSLSLAVYISFAVCTARKYSVVSKNNISSKERYRTVSPL